MQEKKKYRIQLFWIPIGLGTEAFDIMVRLPLKAVTSVEQLGHLLVFDKLKQRKHPHPPPLKTHTPAYSLFLEYMLTLMKTEVVNTLWQ